MRKSLSWLAVAALVLTACQPLGTLLTAPFGYSFSISDFTVFSVITALIFITLTILSLKQNSAPYSKASLVIFLITTPLSIIDIFFYIVFGGISSRASIFLLLIPIVCSFYLMLKYAEVTIIKPIILSLSVILLLMILPLILFFSIFFPSPNTVVKTVYSPSTRRYAEVINSDQGALGGDTLVDVYVADNPFFKISKRVYEGRYGEWGNMIIYWKDKHTLVINSKMYYIK